MTVLFLFLLFFPRYAYAYIDPGVGSYITQVIVATLLTIVFTVKLWWRKLSGFFRRGNDNGKE